VWSPRLIPSTLTQEASTSLDSIMTVNVDFSKMRTVLIRKSTLAVPCLKHLAKLLSLSNRNRRSIIFATLSKRYSKFRHQLVNYPQNGLRLRTCDPFAIAGILAINLRYHSLRNFVVIHQVAAQDRNKFQQHKSVASCSKAVVWCCRLVNGNQ